MNLLMNLLLNLPMRQSMNLLMRQSMSLLMRQSMSHQTNRQSRPPTQSLDRCRMPRFYGLPP